MLPVSMLHVKPAITIGRPYMGKRIMLITDCAVRELASAMKRCVLHSGGPGPGIAQAANRVPDAIVLRRQAEGTGEGPRLAALGSAPLGSLASCVGCCKHGPQPLPPLGGRARALIKGLYIKRLRYGFHRHFCPARPELCYPLVINGVFGNGGCL